MACHGVPWRPTAKSRRQCSHEIPCVVMALRDLYFGRFPAVVLTLGILVTFKIWLYWSHLGTYPGTCFVFVCIPFATVAFLGSGGSNIAGSPPLLPATTHALQCLFREGFDLFSPLPLASSRVLWDGANIHTPDIPYQACPWYFAFFESRWRQRGKNIPSWPRPSTRPTASRTIRTPALAARRRERAGVREEREGKLPRGVLEQAASKCRCRQLLLTVLFFVCHRCIQGNNI